MAGTATRCGGVKEVMKGIKIERGDPMPQEAEVLDLDLKDARRE